MKSIFGSKEKPPINFNLRVIATDLPTTDENFKIKLSLDFIPEFVTDVEPGEYSNPNFDGKRVGEIIEFVSKEVINKVIEFIYYDRSNALTKDMNKESCGDKFDEVIDIYKERSDRKAKGDLNYADYMEQEKGGVRDIVTDFRNKHGRIPTSREKDVTSIRFERLSDGKLYVSLQTAVNGERKLPPSKT